MGNKRTQTPIYVTVNKNGFMTIWHDEPIKNEVSGKWEGNYSFCNSYMYNEFYKLIKDTNINFESEAIRFDVML